VDATHDPELESWVESATGHPDFPIQNLPFGVVSPPAAAAGDRGGSGPRGGIRIGEYFLDLRALTRSGLLTGDAQRAARAAAGSRLNELFALGAAPRKALRGRVSELLSQDAPDRRRVAAMLHPVAGSVMHLPTRIGDYTDFYVGINHALNVGALFRPDNPLLPNYKWVPIGYHGRASTVQVSGRPFHRPNGQLKSPTDPAPVFAPSKRIDLELELGVWIGPGTGQGQPVPIGRAAEHVAGYCLLDDWSARDIQAWEYQPLGPFLSKNFASTVSPWVITPEALAPFRTAQPGRSPGDPHPLPYLTDPIDQHTGALDIDLEVLILTDRMRATNQVPHRLSLSSTLHMYWTVAQLITHHTSGGCDLNPGDLLGSGTISGPTATSYGSLLEITRGGTEPVQLPNGETRTFLHDGDDIILRARATAPGAAPIGFGECRAILQPAIPSTPPQDDPSQSREHREIARSFLPGDPREARISTTPDQWS
jgi:fumarylacetoacetase